MKALKILGGVLLAVVVAFFAVGVFLPTDYQVKRDVMINAPVEVAFPQVAIYKNWEAWSPWQLKDPTIQNSYGGEAGQVGSYMSWTGEKSGTGRQTTTKLEPNARIESHLDFGDMGQANSYWEFHPVDGGTHVVWGFTTTLNNIIARYFGLNLESALGAEYELGLSRLKTLVESLPMPQPEPVSAPTEVSGAVTDATSAAAITPPAQ